MNTRSTITSILFACSAAMITGCAAPHVDFSKIQRPARAPELDAYNAFVGNWTWEAEAANADAAHKNWTGTAMWQWTLDQRCLHGQMSAKSADTEFKSAGVWSWHPLEKEYIWTMLDNWGFPQSGTADYDAAHKHWKLEYRSVGLDGTSSHGVYDMTFVDNDTIKWSMTEWADATHIIKKMEMCGTYKRTK